MDNKECWEIDDNTMTLDLIDKDHEYYVEISRCNSSAEILDWIIQVSKKTWVTDNILASLVRRLDHYIDLQANVCSYGRDGKVDACEVVKAGQYKVWERLERNLRKQATG